MDIKISDWDYIMSAVGNAYFSGLTFAELWACVSMSENREELDAAVAATIHLKGLTENDL